MERVDRPGESQEATGGKKEEFSIIRQGIMVNTSNRMNPLFTLGEEFRFHDSSRFRKKAGDAKLRFYHSFVPVLMSLAAESCRSRGRHTC